MKTHSALSELPLGCRAKVSRIEGVGNMRNRLLAMGFTPDADIEVIGSDSGRQIVKIRGCSLVIDENAAVRVTCALQPVSAPAGEKK